MLPRRKSKNVDSAIKKTTKLTAIRTFNVALNIIRYTQSNVQHSLITKAYIRSKHLSFFRIEKDDTKKMFQLVFAIPAGLHDPCVFEL